MHTSDAPVLFITFNRPETTIKVFEKIRLYKPRRLFIFSDGPRPHVEGESAKVNVCREIFSSQNIDWPCEVTKWFNIENLGCAKGVSSAITRAFKEVDRLIILEDDVVPDTSFFQFCNSMLVRYADEEKVMHVSGTRWNAEYGVVRGDHYFSTIGHIWGWATWKRAWSKYDFEIKAFPEFKDKAVLLRQFESRTISKYWHERFDEVYRPVHKTTWDYQWQFTLFANRGLAIVPHVNLVSNIGVDGVHFKGEISEHHFVPSETWTQLQDTPIKIEIDLDFERYHIKERFLKKGPLIKRLKKRWNNLFIKSL